LPEFQQVLVIAFGLVPGFVASEVQSFVALRRSPPAFEKTLLAVIYTAVLFAASNLGRWGPQFAPSFGDVVAGDPESLVTTEFLARYLLLILSAVVLGYVTGHSLSRGVLRRVVARLTGRDVSASAWQQFFHDRLGGAFWIHLRNGRRIVGQVISASDQAGERVIVLRWPRWVSPSGRLTPIGTPALLVNVEEAELIAELAEQDLPNRRRGG